MKLISSIYNLFWGDLFNLPLPGGGSVGISLLVMILIPVGIYFTLRTKVLPIRCFKDMLEISLEKNTKNQKNSISGLQTLIVATATRVGMGNMVGVVAAVSAGGAGAVFWMQFLHGLVYLQKVLVIEGLVNGDIVVAPTEMCGCAGLLTCTGRTCYAINVDISA